jgi:hypothetical protein
MSQTPETAQTLYEKLITDKSNPCTGSDILNEYEQMKPRNIRERVQNAVDATMDVVQKPIKLATLPVAAALDLIAVVLAGHRMESPNQLVSSSWMTSKKTLRAKSRMSEDARKFLTKK